MSTNVAHAVLSAEPISVDQASAAVAHSTAGAVVGFSGVVRNHDGGKAVTRLAYSAHPSAEAVLAKVLAEVVAEAGDGVRIWAAHRVGDLEIGDTALACAVSAAHRGEAFRWCSELVDRIKAEVPIWKQQFFADGTQEWVGVGE
ncbi:molybdenum cofactor biosynthesis protein MoaE [Pseudarthrobacter sp. J1738]|uniref:molybdenum cofactor biosynthesis protein MoaE n=1 Tax=unclassified Pseudarthrobacter TaxID=2647000 RepID=UPI003D2650FB